MILKPGERLLILRHRAGYSKSDLARMVGTSVTTISNYEKGKVSFDHRIICAIADIFGVSVNWIQCELDDPTKGQEPEPLISQD